MNKQQLLMMITSNDLAIFPSYLESGMDIINNMSMGEGFKLEGTIFKQEALVLDAGTPVEGSRGAFVRDNVGIVQLVGPISPKPNFMTEVCGIGTPLNLFMKDVKTFIDDPNIGSIMIYNSSPGGSVEGVNESANLLAEWGKVKPIVTYTYNQNASASYWLTSKAGKIYGDATACFGSIGVMASMQASKDDKEALTFISSKSPLKNSDPKTKEGKEAIIRRIDAIADIFLNAVAEGRGVNIDKVEKDFGKGDVFIGKDALAAGMIDGISSFEELIQKYSTEALETYTNYKGEMSMELTLETLKAKFPQVHQQACDEAVTSVQGTIVEKNKIIKALEDQVVALEGQIETAGSENATLATRLTVLEKENMIQKAKAEEQVLKSKASKIATEVLSDLPERIQSKVTNLVNYNAFVDEKGVLDEEKYKSALVAEAEDFSSILATGSSLSGVVPGAYRNDSDTPGDDEVVNRMLAAAGIK